MSDIRQFVQGKTDFTLFGLVGPWLSNRAVHVNQDGPIVSEPGDFWHVAVKSSEPVGFALTHPTKQGAHIRNVFVYEENSSGRSQLLSAALKMLVGLKVDRAYFIGRQSDELWARHGFKFSKRGRGEFGTWEREP